MSLKAASTVNLRHIRTFLAVAQLASFTRAADRLSLSQPALTICIRQLEDLVGVALFNRTTRRVRLTKAGEDFLPTAERLIHDFEAAIADVRAIAERQHGRVSLATSPSIATRWLPSIVAQFLREYPGIGLHLHDNNSHGVRRMVRRGDVDFGVAGLWGLDRELEFTPILKDGVGLVCRLDHPLAQRSAPLHWIDLQGYTFLDMGHEERIRTVVGQVPELADTLCSTKYGIANTATLVALLEAGIGVTALPAMALPKSSRSLLAFVPLTEPRMERTICIVQRKGEALSPAAQVMLEAIVDHATSEKDTGGEPSLPGRVPPQAQAGKASHAARDPCARALVTIDEEYGRTP